MVLKDLRRKKYPSDLTDEQWAILGPIMPPAKQHTQGGRPRKVDMREVLNTLLYLHRRGCQWDMLPHDLLPKSSVYDYLSLSGVTMAHGRSWSTRYADPIASASRARGHAPAPRVSIANRSRPPRSGARSGGMMVARKSTVANVICSSIRWACYWSS